MTIEARRAFRGVSGALLALTLVLLAAGSVAQADTIYPTNQLSGTSFDNGSADGFSDEGGSCTLLQNLLPIVVPGVLCDVTDTTNPTDGSGDPPGSIVSEYRTVVDGLAVIPPLALLPGNGGFRSPSFTIGASGPATLTYDRRAILDAVIAIGGTGSYTFYLDNDAGGTPVALATETLSRSTLIKDVDTGWQTLTAPSSVGVIAGQTYHLEIRTSFQDELVVAAQSTFSFGFDNIRLRVQDGTSTFAAPPTAITDPATNVTTTSATLNGRTNAQGLPSTYSFRYGTSPTLATGNTVTGPFNAGSRTDEQSRSRDIGGLTKCTQYYFQIEATNSGAPEAGTTEGNIQTFSTDCEPSATTLAATGVGPNGATLNSAINPNGSDTSYFYEYGIDTPAGGTTFTNRIPVSGDFPSIGMGNALVQPNSAVIAGLAPNTAYRYRVTATNAVGTTPANIVTFTTSGTGAAGPPGVNGTNGATGATGATGAAGTTGSSGAAGPPGPRGPAGSKGQNGVDSGTVANGDPRALIHIYGQSVIVPSRGRNVGRVRVKIFCREVASRTCSGSMKVRSLNPIAPQSFGFPKKAKRRVTFATDTVQLDVGKVGYAILSFNAQRRSVLKREKSVRSTVIVTVIDASNNRQNVRTVLPVRLGK